MTVVVHCSIGWFAVCDYGILGNTGGSLSCDFGLYGGKCGIPLYHSLSLWVDLESVAATR